MLTIHKGAIALAAAVSMSMSSACAKSTTHRIAPGPSATANPLKGFVPYSGSTSFPHSLEWFYLPVSAVQTGDRTFDWAALEAKFAEVSGRGDQACLRFYYDYPQETCGIPAYLLKPGPGQLPMREYTDYGGGRCPDYNGPSEGSVRFRQSMRDFISAFGARYDGDPRIGFITIGLLGFWGEWHTYPHEDWTPSDNVKNLVLNSFVSSFHKTRLEVRYPSASAPTLPIGYHDDSFCMETLYEHNWTFGSQLKTAGVAEIWRTQPIGGELRPELQSSIFPSGKANGSDETWNACVDAVHPTWMLNNEIYKYKGAAYDAAVKASTQMGYDFRVTTATFGDVPHGGPLKLSVDIANDGVAPFYYPWQVQVAMRRGEKVVKSWNTDWDITKVPAGGAQTFTVGGAAHGITRGAYTLAIRVVNPMRGGKPLLFANQGQHPSGWLDLGQVNVL